MGDTSWAIAEFLAGRSTHAHRVLGAHPDATGTHFGVWAPGAVAVTVIGDFDEWSRGAPLAAAGAPGIFEGHVPGARPGHRYKFRIQPASGEAFDKADPFAFEAELAPGTASEIGPSSGAYAWKDDTWMGSRERSPEAPMSIYEVHLGSFRRKTDGSFLCYREVAGPLAAYARENGFTHVELLPLLEHPFYGSWGYSVSGFFAATRRYGSVADLMFLVDTLHQAGVGVILDWVPAHFANDPHGLSHFDGGPLFEPDDPSRQIHPTWNTGLFDFGKPGVRSFLLSSAMYWIETFHADGLRVDGVASIVHRPNTEIDHPEGIAFARELTTALEREHPNVWLIAEDSSAREGDTHPVAEGGLGFHLRWDMGFAHDMRQYLGVDPILRSHEQKALTFRPVYAEAEAFLIPLSHDDVAGSSLLAQMHGDPWQKLANLRLLLTLLYMQPGKKLLFMGTETGAADAWHHDRPLGDRPDHDELLRMVRDLNALYRTDRALHERDAKGGFEWIDGSNASMSVVTFLRRGAREDDHVLVAVNATPVPRKQYRIGVPAAGHYREVFNSDATHYGGSGHGNLGGVDAVPYPWNGRRASIVVTLPPLGVIALRR